MGECIQGLVLLGNQWLLFVELGGFVNNAFFMSQSACLSANIPSGFLFVCCFVVGVFCGPGSANITPSLCAVSKQSSFVSGPCEN